MSDPRDLHPQERLKQLINYSNTMEVDYHVSPTRYYRSGLEMVRMANVYYNEGSLENAYVLYLKFMTLFLEKIRKHPDFKSVPLRTRSINQEKLREILPKAEKLREELLAQYTVEYERHLAEIEHNKARKKEIKPKLPAINNSSSNNTNVYVDIHSPINLEGISYPNEKKSVPTAPPVQFFTTPSEDISASLSLDKPSFDRSKKPSEIVKPYSKAAFRTVVVPSKVMTRFQQMSSFNTGKNIETCGILAGKLAKNELIITHVIVPKQRGTSDSCNTMNEEEIFDFQDQKNLITIGWIHTHPTQTAFLSSVDLHTHCPYQLLMPEAIAIVCAPRYKETGFFVLTPDYGLKFIANCQLSGFHPHPTDPPLFKIAEHVRIDNNAPLEILDLREKKT